MKYLVIFIGVIVVARAMDADFLKQTRDKVRKIAEDCVVEEKAQSSDLDMIMDMKIPETHEGRCVLFCTHKQFNVQNEDGSVNKEGAMETFAVIKDFDSDFHDKVVDAFNHCLNVPTNSDPCMYAASLSICFLKKSKEEGIHELIME